jgi:hypothetical protein
VSGLPGIQAKMEFTLKQVWWRLSTPAVLLALNKLLVLCIAWLFFFYLVLAGWDLHVQQEQTRRPSPFENHDVASPNAHKGGI